MMAEEKRIFGFSAKNFWGSETECFIGCQLESMIWHGSTCEGAASCDSPEVNCLLIVL